MNIYSVDVSGGISHTEPVVFKASIYSGVLRTGSSQNQLRFSDFLQAYISVIKYTIKLQ